MVEGRDIEFEKAKLRANYWNGIALATFVAGTLPLLISAEPITKQTIELAIAPGAWMQASFLIPAWVLSLIFHWIGQRSFDRL